MATSSGVPSRRSMYSTSTATSLSLRTTSKTGTLIAPTNTGSAASTRWSTRYDGSAMSCLRTHQSNERRCQHRPGRPCPMTSFFSLACLRILVKVSLMGIGGSCRPKKDEGLLSCCRRVSEQWLEKNDSLQLLSSSFSFLFVDPCGTISEGSEVRTFGITVLTNDLFFFFALRVRAATFMSVCVLAKILLSVGESISCRGYLLAPVSSVRVVEGAILPAFEEATDSAMMDCRRIA
mmetsp:Transcript_50555/g.125889  ORF Transcript_50555/g.125889 Transcript_50555/m.125889 type:complete len:235 (+) Transcript_50555:1060-1764(+)